MQIRGEERGEVDPAMQQSLGYFKLTFSHGLLKTNSAQATKGVSLFLEEFKPHGDETTQYLMKAEALLSAPTPVRNGEGPGTLVPAALVEKTLEAINFSLEKLQIQIHKTDTSVEEEVEEQSVLSAAKKAEEGEDFSAAGPTKQTTPVEVASGVSTPITPTEAEESLDVPKELEDQPKDVAQDAEIQPTDAEQSPTTTTEEPRGRAAAKCAAKAKAKAKVEAKAKSGKKAVAKTKPKAKSAVKAKAAAKKKKEENDADTILKKKMHSASWLQTTTDCCDTCIMCPPNTLRYTPVLGQLLPAAMKMQKHAAKKDLMPETSSLALWNQMESFDETTSLAWWTENPAARKFLT